MNDHRNTILAVILSGIVLIAWQYFFVVPQMEKQQAAQKAQQQVQQQAQAPNTPAPDAGQAPQPGTTPAQPSQPSQQPSPTTFVSRDAALAAAPRVKIETPRVSGSLSLKGGRIDDLSLTQYRVTVDPKSAPITLLSPSGSPQPYYAEFGWVGASGTSAKLPDANTEWKQEGSGTLTATTPVTLTYDNGEGLTFRRTITIDDNYLFTIKDDVTNNGSAPVTLYPFALISRHGTPHVEGFYILHEGMIGVLGDQGLQEVTYKVADEKKSLSFKVTNGWLGLTDKYWAATLLPDTTANLQARFSSTPVGTSKNYQADYLLDAQTIAPGATGTAGARLFAGAKETPLIDAYDKQLKLNRFELLIDWGWFYFITKPMFWAIDYLYRLVGNFGIAILLVTVLIKLIFFPLANKSYASMAKMKNVQPEMMALRERYPDDKVKQQQEMMALYKREKINPVAGCLPILIQIPVFFALYKVLFVTIEMRHAPFFGWIKDLSAPDPTNLFTLFGLIPYDPSQVPVLGHYLVLGIWPIIMGITMWVQMKLNPAPPDPTQKMIFDWMPLIFTFMLASFPAGLVIYWAWNNTLSVIQQGIIMKKNGAKIELFDNIKSTFARKPQS
ncbi:insertase [Afipia sp. P52-10]|uniref:membrane protein insertase YidC n=1 Tax=Afipia sp. P52-10 TaxID=1429916 RepID=UPI0003DF351D|nr:membrane protein insertase YidC [Afipia sp. P52-10]ETR78269.1 insertase [Afipia sp. P52-10]